MSHSFPQAVSAYLRGLLLTFEPATCTALARMQKGTSHDSLTRLLQNKRLDWQTLLSSLVLGLTGQLSKGYLIIDDTIIDKSFAKVIEGVAWVFCSKKQRSILGLSLVVLAWSNGRITVPLGLKVWSKEKGQSKVELAIELVKWVQKMPNFRPRYVVFDAWYAAHELLKTIESYGWTWISQLKRNRKLNSVPLRLCQTNPYWISPGTLSGGHQVIVVRHGKKYFAASDTAWSKQEVLQAYKTRWSIETLFRALHNQLGLGQCQARSLPAQTAHFHLCLMAYAVLEQEKYYTQETLYALRRKYRLKPEQTNLVLSKLIFQGA